MLCDKERLVLKETLSSANFKCFSVSSLTWGIVNCLRWKNKEEIATTCSSVQQWRFSYVSHLQKRFWNQTYNNTKTNIDSWKKTCHLELNKYRMSLFGFAEFILLWKTYELRIMCPLLSKCDLYAKKMMTKILHHSTFKYFILNLNVTIKRL